MARAAWPAASIGRIDESYWIAEDDRQCASRALADESWVVECERDVDCAWKVRFRTTIHRKGERDGAPDVHLRAVMRAWVCIRDSAKLTPQRGMSLLTLVGAQRG